MQVFCFFFSHLVNFPWRGPVPHERLGVVPHGPRLLRPGPPCWLLLHGLGAHRPGHVPPPHAHGQPVNTWGLRIIKLTCLYYFIASIKYSGVLNQNKNNWKTNWFRLDPFYHFYGWVLVNVVLIAFNFPKKKLLSLKLSASSTFIVFQQHFETLWLFQNMEIITTDWPESIHNFSPEFIKMGKLNFWKFKVRFSTCRILTALKEYVTNA